MGIQKSVEAKSDNNSVKDQSILDDQLDSESEISEVSEFFDGLNVLVTGGSGFLGKVLVEKLLRSCPKINMLYIMMRTKKDKSPEERFKSYFDEVLFDELKKVHPNFINHVEMIEADAGASDLGLSVKDREKMIEKVNVVFHAAATVRFNETLRVVININVRGTKLLLLLAKEMKNIKAFVHISTAFAHCLSLKIDEKFYDPPINPETILSLVDILDDDVLDHLTPKLLGSWPNTYAFSKSIGEDIVRKYSQGIPTCLVRPSIMINTHKEPLRGWSNNIYGATGIAFGAATGVLHSMHCQGNNIADLIPADYVINNIIVAAWSISKSYKVPSEYIEETEVNPPVYNIIASNQAPITWSAFMKLNEKYGPNYPSTLCIWYYSFRLNSNIYVHNLYCILFHTIPGAIFDTLAIMTGRKPMLLKAYKKIHKLSAVTSYFATQEWTFNNDNVMALWDKMNLVDKKKFYFNLGELDWDEYLQYLILGLRVYVLKDPIDTIKAGRVKMRKLIVAHYTFLLVSYLLLTWCIYNIFKFIFF